MNLKKAGCKKQGHCYSKREETSSNKTKDVQCDHSHYDQDDLKKNQNPTKVFMRKNSR